MLLTFNEQFGFSHMVPRRRPTLLFLDMVRVCKSGS
uniref:Uncharacterized protein n=1 Tax=Lepeophtheirus salmonis TaxID=72036 RepID=A0A0K2TE76_LEPSM